MNDVEFEFDSRLDSHFLLSMYEGDKEHAAMVFEQFLSLIPGQLKEVEDSFEAGNTALFRQKLHKIKPVFSFVGLTWLTGKAELIEKSCEEQPPNSNITDMYTDFKYNLERSIPVVEEELKRLRQ